jgi:hypothetical protein
MKSMLARGDAMSPAKELLVARWTPRDAMVSELSDTGEFYAADPYPTLFASRIVLIFAARFFSPDTVITKCGKD